MMEFTDWWEKNRRSIQPNIGLMNACRYAFNDGVEIARDEIRILSRENAILNYKINKVMAFLENKAEEHRYSGGHDFRNMIEELRGE